MCVTGNSRCVVLWIVNCGMVRSPDVRMHSMCQSCDSAAWLVAATTSALKVGGDVNVLGWGVRGGGDEGVHCKWIDARERSIKRRLLSLRW